MKYLDSLNKLGSVPGLDSIRELLHRLGNPQNRVKCIHIAGTNGKGSVGAFICEILIGAGYKVGRYASPAVVEPLEIIKMNNVNITEEVFDKIVNDISFVCNEMVKDGLPHPTRFEVETAAAFVFFAEEKCDFSVVECGMGGLLDATNVVENVVCSVITSISVDHTGFLGETIEEIASHKAGIIKKNVPVVSAKGSEVVMEVIKNKALENNADLHVTSEVSNLTFNKEKIVFDYKNYKDLEIGLLGVYQPLNAAIALECIEVLNKCGYGVSRQDIYKGFKNAGWFGRFSLLGNSPDFIVDGAHNPDGAKVLLECLKTYYPEGNLTFVVGFFADKDYKSILDLCIPCCKRVFTIETPDNPRALSSKALADFIKNNYDVDVASCDKIEEAVQLAINNTDESGAVIVFGSLSHLAMVSQAYFDLK